MSRVYKTQFLRNINKILFNTKINLKLLKPISLAKNKENMSIDSQNLPMFKENFNKLWLFFGTRFFAILIIKFDKNIVVSKIYYAIYVKWMLKIINTRWG